MPQYKPRNLSLHRDLPVFWSGGDFSAEAYAAQHYGAGTTIIRLNNPVRHKTSITLTPEAQDALWARGVGSVLRPGQAILLMMERYLELLSYSLPELTEDDWAVLRSVYKGSLIGDHYHLCSFSKKIMAHYGVRDIVSLPEQARSVAVKSEAFSVAEKMAIIDVIHKSNCSRGGDEADISAFFDC